MRTHKAHGGQTGQRAQKFAQKRQAACKPETKPTTAKRQAGSAGQTKNGGQPAGRKQASDTPAEKAPEHRTQSPPTTAAGSARTASPGKRRGTPNAEKPLRTGKIRVCSFACPEGPCEAGPPKNRFAVFGWHGLFLLRIAQNKRGRRPLLSPAAF